jgi:hypothetical protein
MVDSVVTIVRPQEGYQMNFARTSADIAIGGGAAGVGKTYSLLLEPVRNKDVKGFGTVVFRRTSPQIKAEGGLWDTSLNVFTPVGSPKESSLEWDFGASKLKFSHLEYEKNIYDWQGSQIPLIEFDELTHFTKKMFFYLLTRNRSVCGVKPYVRATCNPDPESWLADFIAWWIDQETGDPIPERDGVLRYFMVDGDNYIWGDSKQEVIEKAWHILEPVIRLSGLDPHDLIKSVTFISGTIYQNKELLSVDPSYLGNLLAQDAETQSSLLHGNWKTVISEQDVYEYHSFRGMFDNVYEVDNEETFITADIALKGSDKFIVGGWKGDELVAVVVMDKSDGKEVITAITTMAKELKVQNKNIAFDADGVGGFVDGFLPGATAFNNGSSALPNPDVDPSASLEEKKKAENYLNLKTQCYYRSGDKVNKGKYKISEDVANTMYDDKMTIRQRFMFERKAIKRDKADADGKLKIIGKSSMKVKLNGQSPDIMDMFMMKEIFSLRPKNEFFTF